MYNIYVVSSDDTLDSIAKSHNTTPQELLEINSFLKPGEPLTVGQRIIVPVKETASFEYHTVKLGDTLYKIAQQHHISTEELAEINGLNPEDYLYEGQILIVPKDEVEIIITREGDTIGSVAKRLNANLEQILLQNPNIYLLKDQLIMYKKRTQ